MQNTPDNQIRPFLEKLRRRRLAAALVIALENASLALWRPLFWALFFASLWLLEIPETIGWAAPGIVLAAFAAGLVLLALRDLSKFRWPDKRDIDRRLERASLLPHRPLAVLEDRLANPHTHAARELWEKTRQLSFDLVAALRAPRPRALIAPLDKNALRIAVLLLFVTGTVVAGPEGLQRIKTGLLPYDLTGASRGPAITLWITPPAYTRLPRLVLEGGGTPENPLSIPAGSTFKLRVAGGFGAPYLRVNGQNTRLQRLDARNWGLEGIVAAPALPQNDRGFLDVRQTGFPRAHIPYVYITDQPPKITLEGAPETLPRGQLRFKCKIQDDYSVTALALHMTLDPGVEEGPLGKPHDETRPMISAPGIAEDIQPVYDLSGHTWAGLPVALTFDALDFEGHETSTAPLHITLPERSFTHPVAQKLVALRKRLAWTPQAAAENAAHELEDILQSPRDYGGDIVVFLSLRSMSSRLSLSRDQKTILAVIDHLWDTALRIEDGLLSMAARDLRDAQAALQSLLADPKAKQEDIAKAMENLRQAMAQYFSEMARELQKRMAQGQMPGNLPPQMFSQTLNAEALSAFLDQMQAQALSGDRDAAQQMLSRLQKMMGRIDSGVGMKIPPQMKFMMEGIAELQKLIERQQVLLDETREDAQKRGGPPKTQTYPEFLPFDENELKQLGQNDLPPPPQKTQPKNEGAEEGKSAINTQPHKARQEGLRLMLGLLMNEAAKKLGETPENMQDAEREMRESSGALGRDRPDFSVPHQEKALEELRQAMNQMNQRLGKMMAEMSLLSFGPGGVDPLGHPLDDGQGPSMMPGGHVKVPDQAERKRVQDIQKSLREKSGQLERPDYELDYFRRLLRQF